MFRCSLKRFTLREPFFMTAFNFQTEEKTPRNSAPFRGVAPKALAKTPLRPASAPLVGLFVRFLSLRKIVR